MDSHISYHSCLQAKQKPRNAEAEKGLISQSLLEDTEN